MRWTETLISTSKEAPKGEESSNAQLLIRAGFIDKLMAGVYTFLPLGLKVLEKTASLIRQRMNQAGGTEVLMPALHPKELYQKTGRWDSFNSLIRFATFWTKTEYALGATHEEVVVPLLKKYIHSYRDLPKYVYQIQDKFRDEKRAKSGLLRGREFIMKDLYSFHQNETDLENYYQQMIQVYFDIFRAVGLGDVVYLTVASGGAFAKFSHEFQVICPAGEDTIYLCPGCRLAINKEIISWQKVCPSCHQADFKEVKAIEVGNIFKLGTKFSQPFDLNYFDQSGKPQLVVMGCYGIGLGRLIGTVVEVLSDQQGLVWPKVMAPFQAHLVGLNLEDKAVKKSADRLYDLLVKKGLEVIYDDRLALQAGAKFADADLIGCPIRITVSKRTVEHGQYEVKERTSAKILFMDLKKLIALLNQ